MFKAPLLSVMISLLPGGAPGTPATGLQLASPEQLRAIPLASMPYSGVELPSKVDLSENMPPPGDQGRQNSCVGWATAYVLKSYQERLEHNHLLAKPDGSPHWQKVFSPAFVYNLLNNSRDGGITYIDALNLLSSQGVVPWSDMPYNPDDFRSKPSPGLLQKARAWRIDYWRQVNVLDPKELKAHLNAGYPVMLGAVIDQGFYKARKGHVWKKREGKSLGGHALVLVGYDDAKRSFKVINSWGPRWADGGYGQIDYAWFARVVREGFVAKDALNGLPAPPARRWGQPEILGGALDDRLESVPEEEQTVVQSPRPVALPPVTSSPGALSGTSRQAHLTLSGPIRLPAGEHPQLVLRIYAQENGRQGPLLSSHLVQRFQQQNPQGHWHADLPLTSLNLDKHPEAHTGQPLTIRVLPELFVDGFGVGVGAMQVHVLPAPLSPPLDQAGVQATFWRAWQQKDDTRLWALLSVSARQELIDYLFTTQIESAFTKDQWQEMCEKGHPLIREVLWSRLAEPELPKADQDILTEKPAPTDPAEGQNQVLRKQKAKAFPLIPQGKSWKIQSLRHWL